MIRDAGPADLPRILEITNDAILHGTALWTITPATMETRGAWMRERQSAGLPVLVAELDGAVQGFGSYGSFRPHDGFVHTVEHSIYIDPTAQRRGLGNAMLTSLIAHATAAGNHAMIGGIASENTGSILLHERHGFTRAATLPQVGRKFDRWLDLVFMHRLLG
ncbi:N-acetyltransferase family protein [Lichenicola sp.]|uniref:GNAT family N-acetyltransferase n=1 Tax=Lichenicola sp. TaxID=2804529 RepID=UPI003B00A3C4